MRYIREPKVLNGITHWQCSRCHDYKPETEYYVDKQSKTGRGHYCRECHRESLKERRAGKHKVTTPRFNRPANRIRANPRHYSYAGADSMCTQGNSDMVCLACTRPFCIYDEQKVKVKS